jgi:DnaJ family protein C protein 9
MSYVFEHVMVSSILEDEERFRVIIDEAIKAGEVEGYKAYTKETKASKEKRRKAAKAEAKEAEEYAKELGVHDALFKNKKVAVEEEAEEAQADEEQEEEEEEEEVKPKKGLRRAPKKKAPTKEAPAKKAAPKKKAKKDEEDISALADLIKSRQQGRMGSLIANIEEKYGAGAGTKRATPEISEEDFQKTQERVTGRSKRTKA